MNFDFSEDQRLLQKTVRDYLEERSPLQVNRNVLESDDVHYDAELWKGAAEMGWLGAAIPEEHGGAGFGYLELVLIAEEVGRALAPIPFGSSVYLATEAILLGGKPEQQAKYLPALAAGERIGTFASLEQPGELVESRIATTFERGKLSGTKIAVPDGNAATFAVVLAKEGDALSLALVDLEGPGVERRAVRSIDPTRAAAEIRFADAPAELLGGPGEGWSLTERVLDRAAVLVSFEQVGGAERAFELTREHALERYAFGRPIASFQALKHRMADMYVTVELARSNGYYGAWALEHDADELGLAACNARVSAIQAGELTSVEMIQIYGGVGFTWEYDCHLFYRRAKHLAVVLGTATEWREKLVRHLVAQGAA
jgi:alkylation response protein AidB-like acyl-CoA dehydrogenase